MPKFDPRIIRQMVEQFLTQMAPYLLDEEREELVTSVVRQFATYDGHAVVFGNGCPIYLHLAVTPLGKPSLGHEAPGLSWVRELVEDWRVDPEELPDIFQQLNRGQSADVVSLDGLPLRLWTNPRTRERGVDNEVPPTGPVDPKRRFRTIAKSVVERSVPGLPRSEIEPLVGSVARQLEQHQGHACLFIGTKKRVVCTVTDQPNGNSNTRLEEVGFNLEAILNDLGFKPQAIPEAIARLNLHQQVEFQDKNGIPTLLIVDPRTGELGTRPLQPRPHAAPPVFCPTCSAVLSPWRQGDQQQTCPQCGFGVSLLQ